MTKTITRDDVLKYIYKETSDEEARAIQKQLLSNTALMEYYNQTIETVSRIDELQLEPSTKAHHKLIDYSASLKFESIS